MKVLGLKCACGKPAFFLKERLENIQQLSKDKMFQRYGEIEFENQAAYCQHCFKLIKVDELLIQNQQEFDFETSEDWKVFRVKEIYRQIKWKLKGYKTYAVGLFGITLAIIKMGVWPEYAGWAIILYCLFEMTKRATMSKKGQTMERK